ncbi:MAG: SDR family NAD(P)-dependent oxidoreductase [Actinomycetota bacterium]|nr:SDR family NAD(P)-dependent oxidoreductase [Actinomycetota bacterium]
MTASQDTLSTVEQAPVVLVTGASSGIGRATAHRLADRGTRLVLAARSRPALEVVAEECRQRGADVLLVPTDVSDEAAVKALVQAAVERFGGLDACVHAAAVVAYGRFEDVPTAVFDQVIRTGVLGTANVSRSALQVFRSQRSGTLVIMGSLLGKISTPYMSSYVATKAAVESLGRVLTIEQRDLDNVHVCVVSPGSVATPVFRQAANYVGRYARPPPPVVSAERVAVKIVERLDHPRSRTSVGIANPLMIFGFRALPGVFDLLVGPLMRVAGLSRTRVDPHAGNVLTPTHDAEPVRE